MKLSIQGDEMTKEDLLEIGKFLTKFFKDRKDVVHVFIEEGLEGMSKEETLKLLSDMFEGRKHYTKIINEEIIGED
jgi:hypothetical protein